MENIDAAIAAATDYTFLGAAGGRGAVETLCTTAAAAGCASVCVNPAEIAQAARLLAGSKVKVCTVVDFPLGQGTARAKRDEALEAMALGASEIDAVANQRLLKYDPAACRANLRPMVEAVRAAGGGTVLKLILECCNLENAEKARGCAIALDLGFDFVKTSTGFGKGGATAEDVALMAAETRGRALVKAAGGIRTREAALAMMAAGAARIGASSPVWLRAPVLD